MAPDSTDPHRDHFERLLRSSPLMAGMDLESRQDLAASFVPVVFQEGQAIVRAGERDRSLGIILAGSAVVRVHADGRALDVARLEGGDIFGEMAFFDRARPRSADVVGTSEGVAAFLPHAAYAQLARAGSPAASCLEKNVLDILAYRMRGTNDQLAVLLGAARSGRLTGALRRFFGRKEA